MTGNNKKSESAAAVNTAEKKVTVFIPKRHRNDTERFVSVNGRNALIRTGEPVEVPEAFAEVIEESIRADAEADRYTAEMSEGI